MYRILVVDDEAKIRLLIRKYAEFEGHEVTEAENGMEAVRLFRRTPDAFDIVIMDVMMPELDGFSAVAEIKKIASPAVIMLSARGEEYDKIHGFELGVDDYGHRAHVARPAAYAAVYGRASGAQRRHGAYCARCSARKARKHHR